MSDEERKLDLQRRAIRAYNDSREADKLGLAVEAQRHWEACVRLCLEERGDKIPPSLEPGVSEPRA